MRRAELENRKVFCVDKKTKEDEIRRWRDHENAERLSNGFDLDPVCLLYTGGSVGMVLTDAEEPRSPLITAPFTQVLPYLLLPADLPFDIDFYETKEQLDSSNVGPEHWLQLGRIITKLDPYYQGIVILHGTDTMTYTASALSFMLDNLQSPVILTGAERPIAQALTDAHHNIVNALQIAAPRSVGIRLVPEVCIYFGSKLMRGNRAKKFYSLKFDGYESPNFDRLGTIEDEFDIDEQLIRNDHLGPDRNTRRLRFDAHLDTNVVIFEVFPSNNACLDILESILKSEVRGIILKTYGTGNAPTSERFLKMVRNAALEDKVIVNVTHCPYGKVEVRLFETNSHLFDRGVINGGDMTVEAAYTKLMWLLGKHGDDISAIKRDMQIDQRGELRYSAFTMTHRDVRVSSGEVCVMPAQPMNFDWDRIDHAFVRAHGITLEAPNDSTFDLQIFFNCREVSIPPNDQHLENALMPDPVRRTWKKRNPVTFNTDATSVLVNRDFNRHEQISLQLLTTGEFDLQIAILELTVFTHNRKRPN